MLKKYFPYILFFAYILLLSYYQVDNSVSCNLFLTIACLVAYISCLYTWLHNGNRLYSLYVIFVLYAMLSNLGQSILFLFGMPSEDLLLYTRESMDEINNMLLFQGLCISAFNVGVSLYLRRRGHTLTHDDQIELQSSTVTKAKTGNDAALNVLLFISLGYAVITCLQMIILRQEVDYMKLYEIRTADGGNVFTAFLTFLSLFLGIRALLKDHNRRLVISCYIFLILGYMVTGSRGLAFPYIGVLLAVIPGIYPKYFKGKYNIIWLSTFFLFLIISGMISITRGSTLNNASIVRGSAFDFITGAVSEMGASARPAVITMSMNDHGFPHFQTILYTLITYLIPLTNKIPLLETQNIVLSDWVTSMADSNSGLGYSFIAEAYMNYGWFGCIFVGIYGWFIVFAENKSYQLLRTGVNFFTIALLLILCKQIFYARAEILMVGSTLRFCLYCYIVSLFIKK